jgi:hypothetical protein
MHRYGDDRGIADLFRAARTAEIFVRTSAHAGASAFLHLAGPRVGVSLVRGELEEAVSLALVLRQTAAAVSIEGS